MAAPETTATRASDTEMVVTRELNVAARFVFEAFTRAELFQQWWVPKSFGLTLLSCQLDVRVGGGYRLVFAREGTDGLAFFGRYLEVTPHSRLVWTNDEGGPDGPVTTVTLEDVHGRTKLVLTDRYPSKAVLDAAIESGSLAGGLGESFDQLEALAKAHS